MFWEALCVLCAIWLGTSLLINNNKKTDFPPTADTRMWMPVPVLSHTLELLINTAFVGQMTRKYGPLFRFHTILGDAVCVGTAAAIKWFLRFDGRLLDAALPAHWNPLLGARSVVAISGDVHKRLRKTLMVAFTARALEGYVPMTQRTTAAFLTKIGTNKSIDLFGPTKSFAMNIALRLIFSQDMVSDPRLAHMDTDFTEWFGGLAAFVPYRVPFLALDRAHKARQRILANIRSIIDERKTSAAADFEEKHDVLENLLNAQDEQGNPLTDEEILDTLLTFIFAGHDTSTASICTSMVALSIIKGTDFERALLHEISTAFPDPSLPIDYHHLSALPHLDAFFKEVLRWCTPIRAMQRKLNQDLEYGDFRLPKGQILSLAFGPVMSDPSTYAHPDRFDPARFLPDRAEDKKVPGSFMPFGGGVRQCLGMALGKMEIKLFLVLLLRGYDVQVEKYEKVTVPIQLLRPTVRISRREACHDE